MSDKDDALTKIRDQMPYAVQASTYWTFRWFSKLSKEKRMTFLVSVIGYVLRLDWLNGYRSQLGGVAGVLGGLAYIVLYASGSPEGSIEKGIAAIIAGVTILGAAGKADKNTEAVKAAAVLQVSTAPEQPQGGSQVSEDEVDRALATVTAPAPNSTAVPTTKGD